MDYILYIALQQCSLLITPASPSPLLSFKNRRRHAAADLSTQLPAAASSCARFTTWVSSISVGMAGTKIALLLAVAAIALSCVSSAGGSKSDITEIKFREYYANRDGERTIVFGPAPTNTSAAIFGRGHVYDYKVIVDGKPVGRSHGLFVYDTIDGSGGQDIFTLNFDAGKYAGSGISFSGHWFDDKTVNEIAVNGGTGAFKFGSGSAIYTDNTAQGYYDVVISVKGVLLLH